MAKVEMTVRIKVAWWFWLYASGVKAMCCLFRCQPNLERVEYWAKRAVKVEID